MGKTFFLKGAIEIANRYVGFLTSKKRINAKFYDGLLEIAKRENITLFFYDNPKSFHKVDPNRNYKDRDISGMYVWNLMGTIKEIHLLKRDMDNKNPFTLAHELGHHFSIKENYNRSEKSADNYILKLADDLLEKFERDFLAIELYYHSDNKHLIDTRKLALREIYLEEEFFSCAMKLISKKRIKFLKRRVKRFFKKF